jgi:hypothetical protein
MSLHVFISSSAKINEENRKMDQMMIYSVFKKTEKGKRRESLRGVEGL